MTATLLLLMSLGAEPWATGPKCAAEWNRTITGVFENAELRTVLRQLAPDRGLALVLDRRINPNQTVTFSLQQEPLLTGLDRFANRFDANVVLAENVAYFGPTERTRWLRTAIAQAENSMAVETGKRPATMRKTIAWDDLTTPREILEQIAGAFHLQIENPDSLPHDLWAAATLPNVTPAEALTLVLIQLDLGWTWRPEGRRIHLTPWQSPALIERTHQPRGKTTAAELAKEWRKQWPELSLTVREQEILVCGRVEDHELVAQTLSSSKPVANTKASAPPTPLSQRRFTLNEKNVPVKAVLQELEKSGAELVFDADILTAAGVDLNRAVTIDVKKATVEEFLRALLGPVNAAATVEGLTISIQPKSSP